MYRHALIDIYMGYRIGKYIGKYIIVGPTKIDLFHCACQVPDGSAVSGEMVHMSEHG